MLLDINTYKEFTELLENHTKVVVKVSTPTCGPCIHMAPIFKELADELPSEVCVNIVVNKDIDPDLLMYVKGNLLVSGVPAFRIVKDKKVVGSVSGMRSKEDLKTFVLEV